MAFFFLKSFLLSLILSSLSIPLTAAFSESVVSGTIQRTTKQQILATVPPIGDATVDTTPQPFLVSPSGRYAASFLRGKTAPGAGGFGNDFCYVRVEDTSTGQSEWESECAPVTDANACTLAFTDDGLEVFDGSNSVWSTSADGNHVVELMLVDQGDMRIVDKDGELAWKASDDARANQGCGLPGSEGLAPESPPFAGQIGGGNGNGPFGQPAVAPGAANGQQQQQQAVGVSPPAALAPVGADAQQQQQQQQQQQGGGDSSVSAVAPVAVNQQPLDVGIGQGLGFSAQPLVDNSPFDSGSPRELGGSLMSAVLGFAAVAAALLVHGLLL